MNDPLNRSREKLWRRKPSVAEEAELRSKLADDPESRRDFEVEIALTRELNRLADAPVPSNFTARVMQAVEAGNARAPRGSRLNWSWFFRSLLPKGAFAALAVGAGTFSYHETVLAKREQLAQSVAAVSQVASLPSPEILKDFDAIQRLTPTPPPDQELLALLQ